MVTKLALSAYNTIHSYLGGVKSLAHDLDMNPTTLDNKVNPHNSTHHLRLDEAVAIMALTENHSLIYVMCDQLGFKPPLPKGDCGSVSDTALLELHASVHKEMGDVSACLLDALEDGQFSALEINAISKEINEVIQALHDFSSRLNGLKK